MRNRVPPSDCWSNRYCLLSVAVIVAVATSRAEGQDSNTSRLPAIVLGSSAHVSADNPTAPHVESLLALNPTNPSELIATSVVLGRGGGGAAVYVSRDTGRSWRRATSFGAGVPHFSG